MHRLVRAGGNLVVEAVFRNPNSDPSQYWSHGFLLKSNGANNAYWVGYKSTGVWRQFHRLGSGEQLGERNTRTEAIDLTPGAANKLQVVQAGGKVGVYINGIYQGSFWMTSDTGGEQVAIYVSDKDLGTTSWEQLSVWRWHPAMYGEFFEASPDFVPTPVPTNTPRPTRTPTPTPTITPTPNPAMPIFGPVSGAIPHDSEDGYLAVFRGPTVQGDVMVEVTFENPFAPNVSHWNYGILFDSPIPETYHHIQVSSKFGGALNHWRRAGRDEEVRGRRSEDLVGLDLDEKGENHIRLIIIGDSGHLYVNDRRASIINFQLGNVTNPDRIALIVKDIAVHGYKYDLGGKTRFEDFTVWRWHPSLFDLPEDD